MTIEWRKASVLNHLPTLPTVVIRLKELLASPKSTAADLEKVIRPDLAVSANLLRLANSPFFGLPRTVESVRHAIVLLGEKRLFEVVVGVAFSSMLPRHLPGYEISASAFWLHSVAVAVLAERLALKLRLLVPELTFSAGLLHDIGKLAVGIVLSESKDQVLDPMRKEKLSFVAAERAALGVDHAEIGGLLCERWQLPLAIVHAARWHHAPEEGPPESQQGLYLIQVADGLAHSMGFGSDVGELARSVGAEAVEKLHLKVQHLEQLASEAVSYIHEAAKAIPNLGETKNGIPSPNRR